MALFYQKTASIKRRFCHLDPADDFRTLKWEEVFGYPEDALKQIKELLATDLY